MLITGIPASGKTTVAKEISKYGFNVFSDKDFLTKTNYNEIIEFGNKIKEVDLTKFAKTVNSKLKNAKNLVLEGIIFPYCLGQLNITFDYIFVLSLPEKKLLSRYKKRKYSAVKVQDNLFVQENSLLYYTILDEIKKKDHRPTIIKIELSGVLNKDLKNIVEHLNL